MYVSRVRNLSDSCPRLSTPFLCFQNSSAACWRYLLPRAGVGTCTDATIPGLTTSHYARSRVQMRGSFKGSTRVHKLLKLGWTTFSGSQQLHLPDQRLRSAYGASDRCHGCGSKFLSESLSDDWLINFSSGIEAQADEQPMPIACVYMQVAPQHCKNRFQSVWAHVGTKWHNRIW